MKPISSTTQDHLPIYDIQDNLIILKDGSAALIIQTSAVNFGLLSEPEQDAIIYAYAALLNSLNFSIQILIRSERKDISSYLELLSEAARKQKSPVKRERINEYRTFISETVRQQNVLDKKFYLIIPFFALELGSVKSLGQTMTKNLPGTRRSPKLPTSLSNIINKANTALIPKRDHLIKQLERIGLTAKQLTNRELLSLLYKTYNPGATTPPLQLSQLTAPLVSPVVKTNEQKTENSGFTENPRQSRDRKQ